VPPCPSEAESQEYWARRPNRRVKARSPRPLDPEALRLFRTAIQIKPDFWVGYNNLQNSLWLLGDEEGAWRAGEEMIRAVGAGGDRALGLYYWKQLKEAREAAAKQKS
jgi:hypothetical protein